MTARSNSFLVPAMVYVGAVGLIGLPVMAITLSIFGDVLSAVETTSAPSDENWFDAALFLAAYAVSMLIGLQVAVEVAALQLGGIEALSRGSHRAVLIRHLGLSVAAVGVLGWAASSGVTALTDATNQATAAAGGGLVVASLAVVVLALSNFRDGYTASAPPSHREG
jgi:hypothetical protein